MLSLSISSLSSPTKCTVRWSNTSTSGWVRTHPRTRQRWPRTNRLNWTTISTAHRCNIAKSRAERAYGSEDTLRMGSGMWYSRRNTDPIEQRIQRILSVLCLWYSFSVCDIRSMSVIGIRSMSRAYAKISRFIDSKGKSFKTSELRMVGADCFIPWG